MESMELVKAFWRWQTEGRIHPFTCRREYCGADLTLPLFDTEPIMVCPVCGTTQPLTGSLLELVENYARSVWPCILCDEPLADGDAVWCGKCKPTTRCERCGHYASICGHGLPFKERIKSVSVDRTSLRP